MRRGGGCSFAFVRSMLFLPVSFLLLVSDAFGQSQAIPFADKVAIEGVSEVVDLSTYLREADQRDGGNRYFFLDNWLSGYYLRSTDNGRRLDRILQEKFVGSELSYVLMDPHTLVVIKDPTKALQRKRVLLAAMQEGKKVDSYTFGSESSNRKESVTIKGRVTDIQSSEPIPFLTIQVNGSSEGTISDKDGYYRLQVPPGKYALNFSFLDYDNSLVDVIAYDDGTVNVQMVRKSLLLDEVVIEDKLESQMATSRTGRTTLSVPDIRSAPSFLGEPDIIKSIQTLPGVTTVSEAAAGFNVRGGSVDQNLILFDGLPVFNSAHVFGFFSAFNPDITRDVTFFKGGIPAEYGGRSSSVLDIKSKDGDFEQWHLKSGIGLISGNIMVEGPVKKGTTSMVTSFRSTYSNWLLNNFRTNYIDLRESEVSFNDGYAKITHRKDENTRISATVYRSSDAFRLVGDTTYRWNSFQFSGNYSRQINPNLFLDVTLGTSTYGYQVVNDDSLSSGQLNFRLQTNSLINNLLLNRGQHTFTFGWHVTQYLIDPGTLERLGDASTVRSVDLTRQRALENAFYFGDQYKFSERLTLEGGVRIPIFNRYGEASFNIYETGLPRAPQNIIATQDFQGLQTSKAYAAIEPRVSVQYLLDATSSVKFGYNRINQFIHLVTNSAAVTPTDIWRPSGPLTRPQRADQLSLGLFKDWVAKDISLGLEGYYKWLTNVLDFKDGAKLVLNEDLDQDLIQDSGKSYGVEFSASKNSGRLTGSFNYTWSRALRQFDSQVLGESINRGEWFPSNFDQPHVINFQWKYVFTRRTSFTGNFSFHSGRPITIPVSAIPFENDILINYSDRNQFRIPDYHRLDLAVVVEGNYRRNKNWKGSWVFSAYNVYARRNPYAIFFNISDQGIPEPFQLAIIGTILPSVSYNVKIF